MPVKILMPALSPTMTEGNLINWLKQEGDEVVAGDVLAEIETDKATMEVEAVDEGTLARIIVPAGTEGVKVNEVIALLLEEDEDPASLKDVDISAPQQPAELEAAKPEPAQPAVTQAAPVVPIATGRQKASPLARRLAQQQGLDLARIQGTGPKGRIVKADIEAAQGGAGGGIAVAVARPMTEVARDEFGMPAFDTIAMTNVRKIIAERLTEAKQTVPHFYLTMACDVAELLKVRKQINSTLDGGAKVSVNDMIIRACALALMKVPQANSSWMGDHVRQYKSADVSVAVATDQGLITPIVKSAERKSVIEISQETKELIAKARAGKLKPQEFQGGTFSISNMGMYGLNEFSAIINPPQGCILAIGAAEKSYVIRDDKPAIISVMKTTLSVDHRVVDGAVGAQFLQAFKNLIENPVLLVMG